MRRRRQGNAARRDAWRRNAQRTHQEIPQPGFTQAYAGGQINEKMAENRHSNHVARNASKPP
jgi:hypothetical protein